MSLPYELATLLEFGTPGELEELLHAVNGTLDLGLMDNGDSLLARAVRFRNEPMVRYLLEQGCDVNLCDRDCGGEPPIKYAVDDHWEEGFRLLVEAGADIDAPGWMAISTRERIRSKPEDYQAYREFLMAKGKW
jgi:hypothetical protein